MARRAGPRGDAEAALLHPLRAAMARGDRLRLGRRPGRHAGVDRDRRHGQLQLQVGYDGSDPRWADQVTGPADFGWAAAGPFPGWGYGVPT